MGVRFLNGEPARNAARDQLTVVILGNARFHTGIRVKEKQPMWEEQGVFMRYLLPYAPHLNFIEALWPHFKGFLLSKCCYDWVLQLKQALFESLNLLGAIRVNSKLGET